MEVALLQPVAQVESNVIIFSFNNKNYGSWQAARDTFDQLKNKKGGNSVWSAWTRVTTFLPKRLIPSSCYCPRSVSI
jgi:hypothetical protein